MILTKVYHWVIISLVASIIMFASSHPLPVSDFGPTSDEAYYLKYANLVNHDGLPAFLEMINWFSSNEEARNHPVPVRVGYILLVATMFHLFGYVSFKVLGFISLVSFILFLCVCFYYTRKYFDPDTGLLTLLFLASSPLMLGLSRRALADSSANLLWALALWLFLDVLFKPKRFTYIFFLISLIISILFKESSVILIPFFVFMGFIGKKNGLAIRNSQIWGIAIYPLIIIAYFFSLIWGGFGTIVTAFMAIAKTHLSSGYHNHYAIDYCSGPWFKYLLDFILLVPIETLLFIGYLGYISIQRDKIDFKRAYFLVYFVYVYGVLSLLAHTKVVRFVINLEMVIALFAVFMMQEMVKGAGVSKQKYFLLYPVLVVFVYNIISYNQVFYGPCLLDPISYNLLFLRHIIPPY